MAGFITWQVSLKGVIFVKLTETKLHETSAMDIYEIYVSALLQPSYAVHSSDISSSQPKLTNLHSSQPKTYQR